MYRASLDAAIRAAAERFRARREAEGREPGLIADWSDGNMDRDDAYKHQVIWAEAQSAYEIKPLSWWESIYDYPGERETAVLDLVAYGQYEDLEGNLTRTEDRTGLREAAKVLWGIDTPEPPEENDA